MPVRPLAWTHRWVVTIWVLVVVALVATPGMDAVTATTATPDAGTSEPAALVADTSVQTDFPIGMTVAGTLAWEGTSYVSNLELLYSAAGSDTASVALTQSRNESGPLLVRLETSVNLQSHYLPTGIELTLWWRLTGSGGTTLAESEPMQVMWMDGSQSWEEHATEQVILYSYALSPSFRDETLVSLQTTVDDLEARYNLSMPEPIRVWVYESYSDFQVAMPPNSRESVAALAFPGYHTIAAIVPNGNQAEMLRVLPHEMSHQVLHQAAGTPFSIIPVWFDEGLATHVQTGGTDGYLDMVVRAEERGELFQLDSLNAGFPFSPAQATLAYATSWSAIAYIEERWGDEGVAALVEVFADGRPYVEAIPAALGISAEQLNVDWTAWVAAQ